MKAEGPKIRSNLDWDRDIYAKQKQLNRWPFDQIVSAILRGTASRKRSEVSVLEIGCGAGNNIWFLAAEGFRAHGLDISPTAIEHAKRRISDLGLQADLKAGDFVMLPWPDATFDYVIDRGALTVNTYDDIGRALKEARRVLKPEGLMMSFCLFGMNYPDRQFGDEVSYRTFDNFRDGYFRVSGLTSFFTIEDLRMLFEPFGETKIERTTVHDENNRILSEIFTVIAVK